MPDLLYVKVIGAGSVDDQVRIEKVPFRDFYYPLGPYLLR